MQPHICESRCLTSYLPQHLAKEDKATLRYSKRVNARESENGTGADTSSDTDTTIGIKAMHHKNKNP